MQRLLTELAGNPDIAYILLVDHKGAVLNQAGNLSHLNASSAETTGSGSDGHWQTHLRQLADGTKVYEFAQLQPFGHLVIGLNMEQIDAASEDDLHHAIMMAVIVLALGASALFFTFVIQKYYGVNRTLRQTQNYTRQVIDSLATGLIRIDSAGNIESCNQIALELLGVPGETLYGRHLNQYLDVQAIGIAETLSGLRAVLEREIGYISPSGRRLPLAVSASPIIEANNLISGAVILLHDLREIKALESKVRRAEKLAAVGELAASLAHEIRNPLSSIKGFAQHLHKGFGEGRPEREYTQIMVQEVDRINGVVNGLLTFARPLEADLQPIDVAKVIAHALRLVQADAKERNIRIETRFEEASPVLHADANQLTQALLNLLINAVTAIDRDGMITIGVEKDPSIGGMRIWVEDDGPGIAPELHEKIFEPFFTNRETGTGLGLAMVRKIVENHNGAVTVTSPAPQSGLGARFVLRLPLGTVSTRPTPDEKPDEENES